MERRGTFLKDKYLYLCALICFGVAAVSMIYFIWQDGGVLTIWGDFNKQTIPFGVSLNRMLREYSGQWDWNMDLGTGIVGAYSYYNLGSPFYWLTLLFDASVYPYLVGPMYILKYMTAGVLAYVFICYFVDDRRYAVLGALLYAFSSFQIANMIFQFHDITALFPLMLIGLEELMAGRRKWLFILSVAVNCLVNYFFFVGEVVFLIIYFLLRWWEKGKIKELFGKAMVCVLCGALGVGMAAVLFFPSVMSILNNPRSEKLALNLYYKKEWMAVFLRGFLFPLDLLSEHFALSQDDWTSACCYLPLWGFGLSAAYVIKRRDWLSRLLAVLTVGSFIPLFNALFYAFRNDAYRRWWYMLTLVMALASSIVLERREEFKARLGVFLHAGVALLFAAVLLIRSLYFSLNGIVTTAVINDWQRFWVNVALVVVFMVVGYLLVGEKKKGPWKPIAATALCAAFLLTSTTYLYRVADEQEYLDDYKLALHPDKYSVYHAEYDPQYRFATVGDVQNIAPLMGNMPGTGLFSSTVSGSIFEFTSLLGADRDVQSLDIRKCLGVRELLGARYWVYKNGEVVDGAQLVDLMTGDDLETVWFIADDPACPLGYAYDTYITQAELEKVEAHHEGVALLESLYLDEAGAAKVSGVLTHNTSPDTGDDKIEEYVKRNTALAVKDFSRDNGGFRCRTDYDKDRVVYFAVPNDPGWTATVDGAETEIINAGGMMCVIVPSGSHAVEFSYATPGLKPGLAVTAVSLLLFAGEVVWEKKRRSKTPDGEEEQK